MAGGQHPSLGGDAGFRTRQRQHDPSDTCAGGRMDTPARLGQGARWQEPAVRILREVHPGRRKDRGPMAVSIMSHE